LQDAGFKTEQDFLLPQTEIEEKGKTTTVS
jgi:hypothetical protein